MKLMKMLRKALSRGKKPAGKVLEAGGVNSPGPKPVASAAPENTAENTPAVTPARATKKLVKPIRTASKSLVKKARSILR